MPLAQPGPTPALYTTARTLLARITRASVITTAIIAIAACSHTSPQASPTIDPAVVIQATPTAPGLPPENAHLTPPHINDYPGITEETEEGAQQSFRFFFDALHYGASTGDSEPFRQASDLNACSQCATYAEDFEKYQQLQRFRVGSTWTATDYFVEPGPGDDVVVSAIMDRSEYVIRQKGYEDHTVERVTLLAGVLTEFTDGQWRVKGFKWNETD